MMTIKQMLCRIFCLHQWQSKCKQRTSLSTTCEVFVCSKCKAVKINVHYGDVNDE